MIRVYSLFVSPHPAFNYLALKKEVKIAPDCQQCAISEADCPKPRTPSVLNFFCQSHIEILYKLISWSSPQLGQNRKNWSVIVLSSQSRYHKQNIVSNQYNIKTRDSNGGCPCGKFTVSVKSYLLFMNPREIYLSCKSAKCFSTQKEFCRFKTISTTNYFNIKQSMTLIMGY